MEEVNSLFTHMLPPLPPPTILLAHVLQGGELVRGQAGGVEECIARFPHPQVIADKDFLLLYDKLV